MKISQLRITKAGVHLSLGGETELDRLTSMKMEGDYVAQITITRDPVYKTEEEPLGPVVGVSIAMVKVKRRKK